MSDRLNGKVAIVTGASRGTGAAIAQLFVEEGARVCLADVLDEAGESGAAKLGESAFFQHMDVRSEDDWDRAVGATRERFGKLDVLINNAAIWSTASIETEEVERLREILDVNVVGTWWGIRKVIAPMREGGGGSIVNISSIAGTRGILVPQQIVLRAAGNRAEIRYREFEPNKALQPDTFRIAPARIP